MNKQSVLLRQKHADILLVNGLERLGAFQGESLGYVILRTILRPYCAVEVINFNRLSRSKNSTFHYSNNIQEDLEHMSDYLLSFTPDIVGFYTICSSFVTVMELARRIHEKASDVKLIYGGPHATITAEACLRAQPYLSAICLGESEKSILPLVKALLSDDNLRNVPGIVFLENGYVVRNSPAPLLLGSELFIHDIPVHEIMDEYNGASFSLEAGRGCPYSCTFCSTSLFWHRQFRIKPLEKLLKEMDRLHFATGCYRFHLEHDIFTADRKYLLQFCKYLIHRGSPYRWTCSSRVDVLDQASLETMAKAGCIEIFFGIESGSTRMQSLIQKNLNLDKISGILGYARKCGIETRCSFIYGFAEETEKDIEDTFRLIEQLMLEGNNKIYLHRFFPESHTEETQKVYDRLYFVPDSVDTSIYPRQMIDEEGLTLIRVHKELFPQYYNFDSIVRKKYIWIEAVVALLSILCALFPETSKYLITRYGIKALYAMHQDLFHELQLELGEALASGNSRAIAVKYLNRLVRAMPDDIFFSSILFYERDWYRFYNSVRTKETHEYSVDIFRLLKGDFQLEEHRYLFRKQENGSVKVEAL